MENSIRIDGIVLECTPLSYSLWEEMQEEYLAMLEKCKTLLEEQKVIESKVELQRFIQAKRKKKLAACVPSFEEHKAQLSLKGVLQLEAFIDRVNKPELEKENLSVTDAG